MSVLLLAKTTDWCDRAAAYLKRNSCNVSVAAGAVGDPMPNRALSWSGEYILSFLSPWIVSAELLDRASEAALNFHPGPPEYPGIGCYNFALYEQAREYGVTCHKMLPSVDTGPIVRTLRFPLLPTDTVASLKERSMEALLKLFQEVVDAMARGEKVTESGERWKRRPFRRSELDALGRVTPDMSGDEVRRRVRAMHYPGYRGAFVEIAGIRFNAEVGE